MFTGGELFCFFQVAAQQEDEGHDHAADEERNPPAPVGNHTRRHPLVQGITQCGGNDDRHLLAARLPTGEKALVAGCGDLGEIHRHTAQFSTGGKALQQPPDQHKDRGEQTDGLVTGHQHNQDGAAGHDRQGHDQAFASTHIIDVGTQHHGAQWTHQEACTEHGEGHHQRGEFAAGRKEHGSDLRGIETKKKEVELFEEVARGDPENRAGPGATGSRGLLD
ncbi:hypothetical protein D9M73_160390 [compost metagenome]